MDDDSPLARARENATSIVSTLVTGIWLGAMFTGQEWWLPALIVGYVVVVPITNVLFGPDEEDAEAAREEQPATAGDAMAPPWEDGSETNDADSEAEGTALERLRRRYAEGELTDEQFERKLERLLETETLEDVEDREWARDRADADSADRTRADADGDREPEPERS